MTDILSRFRAVYGDIPYHEMDVTEEDNNGIIPGEVGGRERFSSLQPGEVAEDGYREAAKGGARGDETRTLFDSSPGEETGAFGVEEIEDLEVEEVEGEGE